MGFNFISILLLAFALLFITLSASIGATNITALTDISTNVTLNSDISSQVIPVEDQAGTHLKNPSVTSIPLTNDFMILNNTLIDNFEKTTAKSLFNEKGVKLFRWSRERVLRFPIRPLKLKKVNGTEKSIQKFRIGYASGKLQTRQTNYTNFNTTNTPLRKITKKVKRKRLLNANKTSLDVFEISSSDDSPSIAFFMPRRTSKRRYTGQVVTETVKLENNTNEQIPNENIKRIPKLLLPKSLRPAMYSLDGFVPRPSMNRITSTEPPTTRQPNFSIRRVKNKKIKEQTNQNKTRRYGQRNRIELKSIDKVDDIDVSDSRRRNLVSKRKGVLTESASVQKPTVNQITHRKRKGTPGKDYPTYDSVPKTGFDCSDLNNGVYADLEAGCQVWHICQNRHKHSFLCPNGTLFNQKNGICDWWYAYDCPTFEKDITEQIEKPENLVSKRAKKSRFS